MSKEYRKAAPKRAKRVNGQHGGAMVRLAAQIAGVTIWSVYGVLNKRVKSKRVQQAIDQARAELNRAERAA